MKKLIYIGLFIAAFVSGCELDNYEPPSSLLTGRITFDGQPVHIRQGISVLQLYQPGFDNSTPINVNVKQDGTFSSLLFDGSYRLVRVSGNGPWENNTDSISIEVNGPTTMDVPVRPYFTLSDVSFSVENESIKGNFKLTNQVAGRQVERATLMVGRTVLLDDLTKLASNPVDPNSNKTGNTITLETDIELSQTLAPFANHSHLFARIGVKIAGVSELIYSDVYPIR